MTINVALTSYPKRINNCANVINSILANTVKPDRIYLTLSHLEFPRYEQDLPYDLYLLIMGSNRVILNWVEDNTKSMKKVFPILPYLEDDDIIIPTDDDMLLPKDFIEARLKDFNDNEQKFPITSNLSKTINMDNMVFTVYSLVQKKMLNGYEQFLTPLVLNTCNDDRTMLYLCHLNGYLLKPCTKYCYTPNNKGITQLPIAPRSDYQYKTGGVYDNILAPWIAEISNGKTIQECFGLFKTQNMNKAMKEWAKTKQKQEKEDKKVENKVRGLQIEPTEEDIKNKPKTISPNIAKLFQYNTGKNEKHDLVYVLGNGSKHNNLEIKISITSMLKFCSDWVNNIYVIGENPHISNSKVRHIYVPDITRTNKDANIIHKILSAIQKIPTLTTNFLFCSDDVLVTKKSSWEDFAPRYIFEYNQDEKFRKNLAEKSKNNEWDKLLLKTLDRFIGYREHIYFYEPHIFAPINKYYFKHMCKQIDYTVGKYVIIMSLWFNWLNLDSPAIRTDHSSIFTTKIPDMSKVNRHLTYNDVSFGVKEFRDYLIKLVTMDEFKK